MKNADRDALFRAAPSLFRCRAGVNHALQAASIAASVDMISKSDRDELLRRAVARERVELQLELLAYTQSKGSRNRNNVRFGDDAIKPMAATGVGTPFLRDHEQYDARARGGTIMASFAKTAAGAIEVRQTVMLVEPGAVERALRGLMGSVSIGWRPTGPIMCTVCKAEIFELSDCYEGWHVPGAETDDGEIVEWEYTAAELVETSEVSVPGVPEARVDEIRQALSSVLGIQPRAAAPRTTSAPKKPPSNPWAESRGQRAAVGALAPRDPATVARAGALPEIGDSAMWRRMGTRK